MKKIFKYIFGIFAIILTVGVLSSCTANFCSDMDTARILYVVDKGVTIYADNNTITYNGNELSGVEVDLSEYGISTTEKIYAFYTLDYSKVLRDSNSSSASENNYFLPSIEFFKEFDKRALQYSIKYSKFDMSKITSAGDPSNTTIEGEIDTINEFLKTYGFIKFLDASESYDNPKEDNNHILYENFNAIIQEMRNEQINNTSTSWSVPGDDYLSTYKNSLSSMATTYKSCISTIEANEDNLFGMYENSEGNYEQIEITQKDWGYAWGKGFFEGLLIYPIAALIDSLTMSFIGGNVSNLVSGSGWAQVGAILLVTLIVRTIMLLITLPSTLSQSKMQMLQPEISKLQQKYPNSNTNQYEKQRLSQETMALYKKHKIHPFLQILVLIVQFPVFICVWGALSASSPLSTGNFYNMNLSTSIWSVLNNTEGLPSNINGWWTAFTLIIIMTICQLMAVLVPMIIQKIQKKKVARLGKNPAEAKQNKTMKIVQWVMLVFIVIMGFTLPSGMGVYWIGGALFSIAQSLIIFFIGNHKRKKRN